MGIVRLIFAVLLVCAGMSASADRPLQATILLSVYLAPESPTLSTSMSTDLPAGCLGARKVANRAKPAHCSGQSAEYTWTRDTGNVTTLRISPI
ncbi:MAG: hypothetical protein KDI19_07105 [Pseudomonadales bacterium]|nr:hypothetical protein [Pseudomonadales bacterium]